MRFGSNILGLFLSLGIAATSWAGTPSPAVGEQAPELGNLNWVVNAPDETSIEALRGDVIMIEKWGVKCPPCLALIPHIQKLHEEYTGRGLHIFAVEAQNHTPEQIRETLRKRGGKTYPVSTQGAGSYNTGGGVPCAWIVGVDGKIIFAGNPGRGNFDATLKAELAKVRYPGLGKATVDEAVHKAAVKFATQRFGDARKLAKAVADDADASDAARADGRHVLDRMDRIAKQRNAKADAFASKRRFLEASEQWNWLSKAFKGQEEGKDASARLKALKKDKAAQLEIKAAQKLVKLLAFLEGKPEEVRKAQLEGFAKGKKIAGTRAAEDAAQLAQ